MSLRTKLHVSGADPLYVNDFHIKRLVDAIDGKRPLVQLSILNDKTGKAQTAIIPIAAISYALSAPEDPTVETLLNYENEERVVTFKDGSAFVGTIKKVDWNLWAITTRANRKYLLPTDELDSLRLPSTNMTIDGLVPRPKSLPCYRSPELSSAHAEVYEQGRGMRMLVLIDTFDQVSADELAMGAIVSFCAGSSSGGRIVRSDKTTEWLRMKDQEPENDVVFNVRDAIASKAMRVFVIVHGDAATSKARLDELESAIVPSIAENGELPREVHRVPIMGKPGVANCGGSWKADA